MNCIVEIKHLYKSVNQHSILDEIRFFLDEKSFIVIDKKTNKEDLILYNIMELTHHNRENILAFNNKRVLPYNQKSRHFLNNTIRYLSEFIMLVDKSVKENLELSIDLDTKNKDEVIQNILEKTELLQYKDKTISECSKDVRQMVLFSELLLSSQKLIFIDELNDYMNKKNKDLIISLLKDMHQQGNGVIVVTDNQELKQYSTKIIEINRKE